MTARQRWYLKMAADYGEFAAGWALGVMTVPMRYVDRASLIAAERARLAGHFGRLALGQTDDDDFPEFDAWCQLTRVEQRRLARALGSTASHEDA